MRTFFGGTLVEQEILEEAGINYPIKLEYYKKIDDEKTRKVNQAKYGISIIKKEYINNKIKVETKDINNITNDEIVENRILEIFAHNTVMPENSEEILLELLAQRFMRF